MKQHTPFILILFFVVKLIICLTVKMQEFSLDLKADPISPLAVIVDKFGRVEFSQRLKFGYAGAARISFPLMDND